MSTSQVVMSTTLSVRFEDEAIERLEEYRQQQKFTPDKSQVIRRALDEYLDRELEDSSNTDSEGAC